MPTLVSFLLLLCTAAYVSAFSSISSPVSFTKRSSSTLLSSTVTTVSNDVKEAKQLLYRAAETKLENPDRVLDAMISLENNAKVQLKEDSAALAKDIMDNISGDWRLIFTTGTKERQEKSGGRVNYFPLKAIQK